jgi:hypothetical protein
MKLLIWMSSSNTFLQGMASASARILLEKRGDDDKDEAGRKGKKLMTLTRMMTQSQRFVLTKLVPPRYSSEQIGNTKGYANEILQDVFTFDRLGFFDFATSVQPQRSYTWK